MLTAASGSLAYGYDLGIITLDSSHRLLKIDSYRPLDSAATLLSGEYHIHVNAEDPPFACKEDVIDLEPGKTHPLASEHFYLPKGAAFEVRYAVDGQNRPADPIGLLRQTVSAYNAHSSFEYKLQTEGDVFTFVPVRGRNANCQQKPLTALLDLKISIPPSDRPTYDNVRLFEQKLGSLAREPVSLLTEAWLNHTVPDHFILGANDEPAREVLLRIIRMTHYRFSWLVREQPFLSGWIINLEPVTKGLTRDHGGGTRADWVLWPGAK
jgi:hypothetical protein